MLSDLDGSMGRLDPSTCSRLPGLSRRQRDLCIRHSNLMGVVVRGVQESLSECEESFRGEVWNCTAAARSSTGMPSKVASKETAYIYALTSAGVTQAIAKGCAKGEMEECSCGPLPSSPSRSFLWSGCSDNVKFGNTFARKFIDGEEKNKGDARSLMNLHNNRVGRRLLNSAMDKQCKCHGVSGSCVTKTCWKVVPKMSDFAVTLKKKFHNALQVSAARVGDGIELRSANVPSTGRTGRYLRTEEDISRVARHALVFLDASPDMCAKSEEMAGRECGTKCREMCCGRGWRTIRRVVDEHCECVFHWCCEVKCKTCSVIREKNYCK